jgi:hypothetical protein
MSHSRTLIRVLILCVLVLVAVACSVASPKPTIIMSSPPHGSQFREGEDVAFQSTAADSTGITRVELVIDGNIVRTDSAPGPQGQQTFTLVQTWKATQGTHAVTVRAYNASSVASDPAAISISVSAVVSTPAVPATTAPTSIPPTSLPTTPPTAAPTAAGCTNNSAFVSDVTVPDGTTLALGQAFNKIWRVRNSGTCTWEAGYQLVFVSGEAMAASTAIAVPHTAPGATADLLVAMTAPNTTGTHAGQWKLKASGGSLFGAAVTVSINVIDTSQPPSNPPSPGGCSGSPTIESFTASPSSITAGGSSTLNWGAVTNADSVEIDQGIGGVAAPGNTTVSPGSTTTYTMTAHCGSNTTTRQATVTVTNAPSGQPDLYVSEFSLTPNPPVQNQNVHVRVGVYNQGNAVATGPFTVEWWAGSGYPSPACTWTVTNVNPSGGRILECDKGAGTWGSWYANITTRVKVDAGNSVAESNEGNNVKDTTIQVLQPKPDLHVTALTINPTPPNHSANVSVSITVHNQGTAAAGAFQVEWWGGSNYPSAECTWPVSSLAAGASQTMGCSRGPGDVWASWYGSITTRVKVDPAGAVSESDETNNVYDRQISVQ